jgi:hypothetical protein
MGWDMFLVFVAGLAIGQHLTLRSLLAESKAWNGGGEA